MIVSARSHLSAGLAAGLVLAATGAAVVAPTAGPPPIRVASPAVALTAAFPQLPIVDFSGIAESPGDWIINAYGVIQPWVAYGVELFAWATEWLPWPIGLLAPQSDIIYNAWQPFAESVVFSFAFLVDGEFDLIPPTLSAGIQTGITNLVQGEIDWILSFFPPLPPIGFAAAAATTRTVARLAQPAAATTEAVTTETATAETVVSEAVVSEAESVIAESEQAAAESGTPAAESEAVSAPVPAAEEQPAAVEVAEPEAVPQPRRATRGAARMAQSVPAASATEVGQVSTAAPEVAAEAAPEPKAHKASRGADSSGSTARAGRAERAAR